MTSYTATTVPALRLVTAWRHDPEWHGDQLVHAAAPGAHVAECGVQVTFFGRPWPAPGTSTLQSRCSICAQAVQDLGARPRF